MKNIGNEATATYWHNDYNLFNLKAINDNNEETCCHINADTDKKYYIGLTWDKPVFINKVVLKFVYLLYAFEPTQTGHYLEYFDGKNWIKLTHSLSVDYKDRNRLCKYRAYGDTKWEYCFKKIKTNQIRIVLSEGKHLLFYHLFAIRHFEAYQDGQKYSPAFSNVSFIDKHDDAPIAESDINLLDQAEVISKGNTVNISWREPKIFSKIFFSKEENCDDLELSIKWLADGEKNPLKFELIENNKNEIVVYIRPLAIKRLEIQSNKMISLKEIHNEFTGRESLRYFNGIKFDSEEYFTEVRNSNEDLLRTRFLETLNEPDFNSVGSLLLPQKFYKSIFGLPNEAVEVLSTWNGALILVENAEKAGYDTGWVNKYGDWQYPGGMPLLIDRWFMPICGKNNAIMGSFPDQCKKRLLDDGLPGMSVEYTTDEAVYKMTSFCSNLEGQAQVIMSVNISNQSNCSQEVAFGFVLGRSVSGSQKGNEELKQIFPTSLVPLKTNYVWNAKLKTLESEEHGIILQANEEGVFSGNDLENVLSFAFKLSPGENKNLFFKIAMPHRKIVKPSSVNAHDFELNQRYFNEYWQEIFNKGTVIETPDSQINNVYKNMIAQIMIGCFNNNHLKYGVYCYEEYYGLEEPWAAVALAQSGHWDFAKLAMNQIWSDEKLDKKNYHFFNRVGNAIFCGNTVCNLVNDREWLLKNTKHITKNADDIIKSIKNNAYFLPKRSYGGDIQEEAHSVYSNIICWRGLRDAGLLLEGMGDERRSEKYLAEAELYKSAIFQKLDEFTDKKSEPWFVPMAFEIGSPESDCFQKCEKSYSSIKKTRLGHYWNLFMCLALDTDSFDSKPEYLKNIMDYIDQKGALLLGTPVFDHALNGRGTDAIYGIGYFMKLLETGRKKDFLFSLYSMLTHGMSRDTYSMNEVNDILVTGTSNSEWRKRLLNTIWGWGKRSINDTSEPLTAGCGVVLQMIRNMMVRESKNQEGLADGKLLLFNDIPKRWFDDGCEIKIKNACTSYGKLDIYAKSELKKGRISINLNCNFFCKPKQILIKVQHPKFKKIKSVDSDGARLSFDNDVIMILKPSKKFNRFLEIHF